MSPIRSIEKKPIWQSSVALLDDGSGLRDTLCGLANPEK